MSSNFATAVQMAITLLVSALLVTGCSKSTSDEPIVVVVKPATHASDGIIDSTTDSGVNEISNSMSGATNGDGSSNPSEPVDGTPPLDEDTLEPVNATLEVVANKTFRISWEPTQGAQNYRVFENTDGLSGFVQISADLDTSIQVSNQLVARYDFNHRVALYKKVNARYIVQACNADSCVDSDELIVSGSFVSAIGYFKASNADTGDILGTSVALNSDGTVLAIGSTGEDSASSGVNGSQNDNSLEDSGAVYIFELSDTTNGASERWQQTAYIKASNPGTGDRFGNSVSLSADGNMLAVGVRNEDSAATSINGNQRDNTSENSGAVYVFANSGGNWQQQAYLKASNSGAGDAFGFETSLSGDGKTLVVGAMFEDGNGGINRVAGNNLATDAGAVYVFTHANGNWQQEAYLKASNAGEEDRFGGALSLSADGNTLAVGASNESSAATGVNVGQNDNSAYRAGAVYLFERTGTTSTTSGINTINGTGANWQQKSYLKASNADEDDYFGGELSLSADGETLAVTATGEDSTATGINGNQDDSSVQSSGAVYVFEKSNGNWQQLAYVKSSNAEQTDLFGTAVSLSGDGSTMVVGATFEASGALGINGNQFDNSSEDSGAAYVFERINGNWRQLAYVKANNTFKQSWFGDAISLSANGDTLAIGSYQENNRAAGMDSNQPDDIDNMIWNSGAVYLY